MLLYNIAVHVPVSSVDVVNTCPALKRIVLALTRTTSLTEY